MTDGDHRVLMCECGNTILLPREMLDRALLDLRGHTTGSEPIAVLCDRCTRVRNFDLANTIPHPQWGRWVALPNGPEMADYGFLECGEKTCASQLPFLGKANSPMPPAEKWQGLVCPKGHPIPMPEPESEPE